MQTHRKQGKQASETNRNHTCNHSQQDTSGSARMQTHTNIHTRPKGHAVLNGDTVRGTRHMFKTCLRRKQWLQSSPKQHVMKQTHVLGLDLRRHIHVNDVMIQTCYLSDHITKEDRRPIIQHTLKHTRLLQESFRACGSLDGHTALRALAVAGSLRRPRGRGGRRGGPKPGASRRSSWPQEII